MSTISHLLTFYFRCLTVKMSKLDCWTVGLLDCWTVGLLNCWTVGLLDCWTVGLLKHFLKGILYVNPLFFGVTVGLLECWTVGLLDSWTFKTLSIAFLVFHILTVFQRYLLNVYPLFFWCPTIKMSKLDCWTVGLLYCWTVRHLDSKTVEQLDSYKIHL